MVDNVVAPNGGRHSLLAVGKQSRSDGQEGPSMPSRNRAVPAVLIIILLALLAIMAPALAKLHNDPETWVTKIQILSASPPVTPHLDMRHGVWVNRRSGFYYCRQSKFYGRIHPGESMRQEKALERGYRPAQGKLCP